MAWIRKKARDEPATLIVKTQNTIDFMQLGRGERCNADQAAPCDGAHG